MSLTFRKYIIISCFFATICEFYEKGVKLFIIKLSSYVYDHADHYNQNQLMDITRLI